MNNIIKMLMHLSWYSAKKKKEQSTKFILFRQNYAYLAIDQHKFYDL